ncbi:MAG: TetR/AcrR family transcriptional regulator [Sutterellaceae bacterium]|nr:TetR/AcrR family transcriptional regulator [Burkholderiaceae bacterium]MCX7902519.1 TetR/AcrR family transcriptional regulator [Burkholderiaceae bacterium]MDW8429786.1 TetR/AcrR family transcriptional regulator [Sutterellaceae bacterium]
MAAADLPQPSSRRRAATAARRRGNGDANRRTQLVRVAARLFRERGFNGTTVRDIAQAVGMRSGSPFYYFDSKEQILFAVMEEGLRVGLVRSEAAVASGGSARQRFAKLVRAHLGILLEDGSDFIPVMLYEWRRLPASYRRRLIAVKDRYDALWQQLIAELIAQGALRGDPKLARLLILGAVNFAATWYRRNGPLSIDQLAHATTEFFLTPARSGKAR